MARRHGSADERSRGIKPRAANPCSVHAHGLPDLRAERTPESVAAEAAYPDWSNAPPTERPLAAQRPLLAKVLFEVLRVHDVSRNRFADMIGVNEKQVRKMLDGRSPVPMAVLGVMPIEMTLDFLDRVVAARGGEPKRAIALVRQGIDSLRRGTDRVETQRAVHEAQRQLLELAAELSR